MHDYWSVEIRRLIFSALFALGLGFITGYWLITALVVALGYITWSLYKLRQLQKWLVLGQRGSDNMPDSDGAWEQIAYLIHRTNAKQQRAKKRQTDLLLRFDNIISALPDAVILLDEHNVIQWSNATASQLLGINKGDTGHRIDNLVRSPDLHHILEHDIKDEICIPSPRSEGDTLELRLLPVQKGLKLLNIRDVSQRVQLQRTRKAFIANASHELRTPLTVVSGYLELLDGDEELPELFNAPIQQAREQTERMQHIINDMLTLSRIENNDTSPKEKAFNLSTVVNNTFKAIGETIGSDSHTLEKHITADIHIMGDEGEISSVVTNLIANAVKHTPIGTHITVSLFHYQDQVIFDVHDTGSGIPAEHLEHLTERFYRVDSGRSRETGGTGLGLSIVKHVMQNHDGNLEITSQPQNTLFRATFPAERIVQAENPSTLSSD